jgi:hypothetical protein
MKVTLQPNLHTSVLFDAEFPLQIELQSCVNGVPIETADPHIKQLKQRKFKAHANTPRL